MLDFVTTVLRAGSHHMVRYEGEQVSRIIAGLCTLQKMCDDTSTIFDDEAETYAQSINVLTTKLRPYAVNTTVIMPADLLEEVFDTLDWGDTLTNQGVFDHITEEAIYNVRQVTGW